MALEKQFYVHSERDGELGETNAADVRATVETLAASDKGVLHFHGGLVKREKALAKAEMLVPVYQAAGAHPVFFVWESGLLETLRHNLSEIEKEKIFKILVRRVLKHTVGKLFDTGGAKSVTGVLQLPNDPDIELELAKLAAGEEPYAQLEIAADLDEVTDPQEQRFEQELRSDTEFQDEIEAVVAAAHPEVVDTSAKGVLLSTRKSAKSLMSPAVVDELVTDRAEAAAANSKGVLSTAKLIVRAGKLLRRVVKRLRAGRGHGVYVTVVEEILRDLYIDNVGAIVWQMMKKETADTFDHAGVEPKRAGWLFVEELGRLAENGALPKITLVGHSTGAIFIAHLLAHVEAARNDPNHRLPADFVFENVVFLAPAISCALFADTLARHRHLFASFRMFTMTDDNEADDKLVPIIYPRSLLYFVAGVAEREADGTGASDLPLVGMQRYFSRHDVYTMAEVEAVREFLAADADHVVWSVDDRGDGLATNALSHGAFDDLEDGGGAPLTTLTSVQQIIQNGA